MTNSVTVAMTSNGSVKYEMRLLFNRCHGENPISCREADLEGPCEFGVSEFFISESIKMYFYTTIQASSLRASGLTPKYSAPRGVTRSDSICAGENAG